MAEFLMDWFMNCIAGKAPLNADKAKEKMRDFARVEYQGVDYFLIGESFLDSLVKEMVGDKE